MDKISWEEFSEFQAEITFSNTENAIINSIRRTMMNEVPTLAIDLVSVEINTTIFHDEFISHRLGLIPLDSRRVSEFLFSRECDCNEICSNCSCVFSLDITTIDKEKAIFSTELKNLSNEGNLLGNSVKPVHNSGSENFSFLNPILIAKLKSGQRLKLLAIAKKGSGKEHSKWSPVSVIRLENKPFFFLNILQLNHLLKPKKKKDLVETLPNFFQIEEFGEKLIDKKNFNNSLLAIDKSSLELVLKCLETEKINPEEFIETYPEKNQILLNIESTGALPIKSVFSNSIEILKHKLNLIGIHLEKFR